MLAVLIGAFGVIGIAGAAPAAAANCNFGFTAVVYTGTWDWDGTAYNCTSVNAVEFRNANTTATVYMVDVTRGGAVHYSTGVGGVAYSQFYPVAGAGTYAAHYHNGIWGSGCGAPAFVIYKAFQVRIHNTAGGGSWGGWFNEYSQQEAIC